MTLELATRAQRTDEDRSRSASQLFRILIVEPNDFIRGSLASYLSQYHLHWEEFAVSTASGARQVREAMSAHPSPDLVLIDLQIILDDTSGLLEAIRTQIPQARLVLTTARSVEEDISHIQQLGILPVVTKTVPFSFEEFGLIVDNLRDPARAFGLSRYLGSGLQPTRIVMTNSDAIMTTFFELQAFFEAHKVQRMDDLCTALIEAITNAIYHAIGGPDGEDKYQKGQYIEALLDDETVTIDYGACDNGLGVSIVDQGGRLDPQRILYWLARNMNADNLMDTHGRGLFLIYTLCDRLIINLDPGQRTEIILLNYAAPLPRFINKPILIHQR